ncbi:MAG TPA: acyltransferase domain-containing protein, partial [Pirellulales bacterium]|nr:acyltransferase domain-containing protein [Pirellulales bacterium]
VLGTRARCEAIEAAGDARGGMLSVAASGEVVERFCREVGDAFPANYNAPQQTVVGGTQQALDELEARLKAQKIGSKRLAVPRPFHTPLMRDTQPKLSAALALLAIQSPRVGLLSSVTNRPVSSADEVRSNLVAQMISPVRYVDLVKQLVGHGVRALVEVGPHQVLTGLNQQILANQDVLAIASDDKARGGLPRLLAVKASLEVRGFLDRAAGETPAKLPAASTQPSKQQPPHGTSSPGKNGHSAPKIPSGGIRSGASKTSDSTSEPPVLRGSAYDIGLQHGRAMARQIQNVARRYADISGIDGDDAAEIEPLLAAAPGLFNHDEREQLRGIAEGAGVSAAMLAVYNVWADLFQTLAAAHVTATPDDAGSNRLHAFQERPSARRPWGDLGLSSSLRIYQAADGLAYALVAWPGRIGASAGMNEQGLAITSASSSEADPAAAPTALRSLLVQRVLRQASTLDAAIELLSQESGNLAAEFCVSHPAASEVRYVRLSLAGKPQVTARPALMAIVESRQLEAAASTSSRSVDSSWLTPGGN